MQDIVVGALVMAHLHSPKERFWGLLVRLDSVGVVIRGLDLNALEDWLRQERDGLERLIAPSTQFVPMQRVERLYLDESTAGFRCFADRYLEACGRDAREALAGSGET